MMEIDIDLEGIDLNVFYEINTLGINILFIYHNATEISKYLNYWAVSEIRYLIWEKLEKMK